MAVRFPIEASSRLRRWLRPQLIWFLADLTAPTALIYVLLGLGSSLYVALLASASLSAASALISWKRSGKGQSFAPYMLAMTMASLAIALVSGSDRFMLARESLLTALMGAWFLRSIWQERPLTYQLTRAMFEGRWGRTSRPWEAIWASDAAFRHAWKVSSVIWAGVLFGDAVLRVVIAYTMPVRSVPAMQTGLILLTTLLMQVVTGIYYSRTGVWQRIGMTWGAPAPEESERGAHDVPAQSGGNGS